MNIYMSELSNSETPSLASRSDQRHDFPMLADTHHCLAPHTPETPSETPPLRPHRELAQMYANPLALHCFA